MFAHFDIFFWSNGNDECHAERESEATKSIVFNDLAFLFQFLTGVRKWCLNKIYCLDWGFMFTCGSLISAFFFHFWFFTKRL